MNGFMKALKMLMGMAVVGIALFFVVAYYPYIFSKSVDGVLVSVEKIQLNVALMQTANNDVVNPQLFSFAIAIRTDDGEILTASAEDRQWAASQLGRCVQAQYYPYPPWKLSKGGTYFNARLDRQYECPDRAAAAHKASQVAEQFGGQPSPEPGATPAPTPDEPAASAPHTN